MKEAVGVIGAGAWGTTLAKVIAEKGRTVLLWAHDAETARSIAEHHENARYLAGVRLPAAIEVTTDLERACADRELLLMAVPSHAFREVARELGRWVAGDQLLVHGSKGFEQDGCKRMSEILREETCLRKIGVLSGPNLSREVAAGRPAGTLVASKYDEVVRAAQQALHTRYFLVYGGGDVTGAEVGGAYKNVVAVAAGVSDGLGLGDNAKSLLIARSLEEMARIGALMGAERHTFWGLSGIGDLVATCTSPLSRNHKLGERLARGESLPAIQASMIEVAEGVRTARALHTFARDKGLTFPIVAAVHSVLYEGATARDALAYLMSLPAHREFVEVA